MRYLFILLLLGGCSTTQLVTSCERAKQVKASLEQVIEAIDAACNDQ